MNTKDLLIVDRKTEMIPQVDGGVIHVTTGIKVKLDDDSEHWINIFDEDGWKEFEEYYRSHIKDAKSYKDIKI